jgi:hypothetical protein
MRVIYFGSVWPAARRERVQRRRVSRLACLMVFGAVLLGCVLPQAASAESGLSAGLGAGTELGASAEPEPSLTPSATRPYTLCPPGGRMIECNIVIDPPTEATPYGYKLPGGGPLLEGGGVGGGLNSENLQSAYKTPTTGGSGETVALVDAYGYKEAQNDLTKYREANKLYYKGTETACTKENGCLKKVNEKGEEANYPAEKGGLEVEWSIEQALDLDMVSAACPSCKILLVEASTQNPADTAASVEEAAKLKATEISNSYGYPENNATWCPSKNGCKEYLAAYDQPGIPVMVSAGDSGYDDGVGAPSWPATSPNIIAVGGTGLKKAENARGWTERAWKDSGSGCSLYEAKPTWQKDKGCEHRTDNDVAADASFEESPVAVYNSPYAGGWLNVGGTSVSSPFVAGVEAHATSVTKRLGAEAFYKKPSMLFHISEGSNGSCGAESEATYYLCHATKEGYNGPTGEGTPNGVFNVTAAPTVTTGSATSVTETGATLNGTVNPNGLETKYYFEYGTTEAYGAKTAEASAGSGESGMEESKAVTGLTLGTTYDLRITATNSEGTSHGANQKVTPSGKPSAETKAATSIGETEATLNGTVNPKGAETKYYFEYGTTESYGTKTAEASAGSGIGNVEESKATTGLTPGTIYDYRIVATNANGTTHGENKTFTPSGKPSAETKAATRIGETEATLNGTVNPKGVETKYYFEYGTTESYGTKTAEASAGSGVSNVEEGKAITGLTASTTYDFRLVATNTHGTTDGPNRAFTTHPFWSLEEPLNVSEATRDELWGVSCTSASACIAVGRYHTATSHGVVAEKWNGTAWANQEPVTPEGTESAELKSVSCTSATACIAVGGYGPKTLAEQWNGTGWKSLTSPDPGSESHFDQVSCTSATACMAVGYRSYTENLVARWNGTEWKVLEASSHSGAERDQLWSVSCAAAEECTVVEGYYKEGAWKNEIQRWNGTTWKIEEIPSPKGAQESSLETVSCPSSSSACVAVGTWRSTEDGEHAWVVRWTGAEWKLEEPSQGAWEDSRLAGISCITSSECIAVGSGIKTDTEPDRTLAERWNGSEWKMQEPVNPSGEDGLELKQASCTSSLTCMAVGFGYVTKGPYVPLAELYE